MITPARGWEELKRIKSCDVYFFPDAIYVVASARTVPGFEIDSEPVFKLDRQIPPPAVGDAIIAALNSFRIDVAPPDPRATKWSPLLIRAERKSWKQIEKVALHVTVSLDGATVRVMPTERDARRGGYAHRPDLACDCTLQPEDIGMTVLGALERCS